MRFQQGADVINAQDDKVGTIHRVVMDPRTHEITHILVEKGFLFTTDKLMPIEFVEKTEDETVYLREGAGDLEKLPDYQEQHYIAVDEDEADPKLDEGTAGAAPVSYWYPPVKVNWWRVPNPLGYNPTIGFVPPPYVVETEKNIPQGTIALKTGANVVSADGETLGKVTEVLADPDGERATHIVVTQGLLSKEHTLVPTAWISHAMADEIHLAIREAFFAGLADYEPEA